jgi:hypothetical protein
VESFAYLISAIGSITTARRREVFMGRMVTEL